MVETSSWLFIPLLLFLLLEGMKFSEIYIVSGFLLRQVMGNWFFLIEKENRIFLLLENRRFAFLTSNYLFIFYLLLVLSIIISGAILHSHFTGLLSSENHEWTFNGNMNLVKVRIFNVALALLFVIFNHALLDMVIIHTRYLRA